MRKRYCELIRLVSAEIVNDPADIDAEVRYLITSLPYHPNISPFGRHSSPPQYIAEGLQAISMGLN
jgi:hypothetical protein